MSHSIFALGLCIMLAQMLVLTLGTIRTIITVQGHARIAFLLGAIEVALWLSVISTVLAKVSSQPVLGVFYVLGFAAGNVCGILIERKLALGHVIMRAIAVREGQRMAEKVRQAGFAVTTIEGQGVSGAVSILFVVCRRKDLRRILPLVKSVDANVFYSVEAASEVSRIHTPFGHEQGLRRLVLRAAAAFKG